jgi:epoxyqueuosine reductase QueG
MTTDWSQESEPGVDVYTLESAWASIEEESAADPNNALSQFADIVRLALNKSGHDVADPVASAADEPEVLVAYRAARDTAERAELGSASRSEVEQAIADLREVFESVVVGERG